MASQFYMRMNTPSSENKYYHNYNYNPFATASLCMPNCTCYAFGRFSEIMGSRASLPTGNAGTWYGNVTAYKRSSYPQVGAVMCWGIAGRAGHVAIVEKVNLDSRGKVSSVVCSQSSYGRNHDGMYFGTSTLTPPGYTNWVGSNATFQGFILNPAVASGTCKRLADGTGGQTTVIGPVVTNTGQSAGIQTLGAGEAFIARAKSWAGKNPQARQWVQSMTSIGNGPWCAAFVCACAKDAKILGKVIGESYGCNRMAQLTCQLGGQYAKGPAAGNTSFIPRPGDLVFFVWNRRYSEDYDHVGIVIGYSTNPLKLITVEGNMGGGCIQNEYTMNGGDWHDLRQVAAYIRPDWNKVGGMRVDVGDWSMLPGSTGMMFDDYGYAIQMFDKINTREDAIIREVGYVNKENEPSINTSSVKLSVINYTPLYTGIIMALMQGNPMFSELQSISGGSSDTTVYNSSNLEARPKQMFQYLTKHGMNAAAACGIIANAYHESGYRTDAVGDNGTSFGLFQWHTYGREMISKVPDWKNNMSGQLDYLLYQLTSVGEFKYIYTKLKAVPVSEAGARQAADIFVREYERPANVSAASSKRQATASELWKKLIPTQVQVS